MLLETYAKEGLAKNYDFNLLAAVKTTKLNLDKISPSDFTMGETNEVQSWIADGDDLSVMRQGSIESIISLPQSVALTSNTPYTAGLEMQHEQLNADLLEAAASEQYYPTPKGTILHESEVTVNQSPLHENGGD